MIIIIKIKIKIDYEQAPRELRQRWQIIASLPDHTIHSQYKRPREHGCSFLVCEYLTISTKIELSIENLSIVATVISTNLHVAWYMVVKPVR